MPAGGRPAEELLSPVQLSALLAWESYEQHFEALGRLRDSYDRQEDLVAVARWLCHKDDEELRALGFDLLAVPAETALTAAVIDEAARLDLDRAGADLRWSAAHALGATGDAKALPQLLRFAGDPDADVRWQVAAGVPLGLDPLPPTAVDVLLGLMSDSQKEVRDWATFTLGVQYEVDTPRIRDALVARLDDPGAETAGEAAVALAKRGDPRVYDVIAAALARPDAGNLYVEAAAELGDPRLHRLLCGLKARGWQGDEPGAAVLDEAIAACAEGTQTAP
jgi:HEAT repeat protein/PBS lyase HEAT-like repeat-containing protein